MADIRDPRTRPVAPADETAVLVDEGPTGPPLPGSGPPAERDLWPWMLVLLGLVLAGLAVAYLSTRDDKKSSKSATETTAPARTVAPAPVQKTAPSLIGMTAPAALQKLEQLGVRGTTRGVFSTKPRNVVVSQQPGAGATLSKGSVVTLNISKGSRPVPTPDVVGQDEAAAVSTVKAQGLVPDVAKVRSDQPEGQVVAQHPVAGKRVAAGSGVRLNVSSGAPATTSPATTSPVTTSPAATTVTVPDSIDKKLLAARRLIRHAGLVTAFKRVPNELPKGTVVSQFPKPGTTAKRGAQVLVNVSLGPKPVPGAEPTVPDVTGEDEASATQDLRAAGYQALILHQNVADRADDGVVIKVNPPPGRSLPARSKVTIYVGRFGG